MSFNNILTEKEINSTNGQHLITSITHINDSCLQSSELQPIQTSDSVSNHSFL